MSIFHTFSKTIADTSVSFAETWCDLGIYSYRILCRLFIICWNY